MGSVTARKVTLVKSAGVWWAMYSTATVRQHEKAASAAASTVMMRLVCSTVAAMPAVTVAAAMPHRICVGVRHNDNSSDVVSV
jgi:hypothetical protein